MYIFGQTTCPKTITDVHLWGTKTTNADRKPTTQPLQTSDVCISCLPAVRLVQFCDLMHVILMFGIVPNSCITP